MKSTPLTCAAVLLLTLSLSDSADAIRCRQWDRLGPAQKEATIQGLIDGLARNNSVRQTNVNLVTVTRCLNGKAYRMQDEFDGACARGMSESLDVLDRIFKTYAWSCIR